MSNSLKVWWRISKDTIAVLFAIATAFLSFLTWDELGISNLCCKLICLLFIFAIAISYATIRIQCMRCNQVWSRGSGKIIIRYGDLFKIAFSGQKEKHIVVIPVNTNFDTIVESVSSPNPLVSDWTLHGKWLNEMSSKWGSSSVNLEQEIFSYLDSKNFRYENVQRSKGSNRRYERGTCAIIKRENTFFFLLALSEFDNKNNAYCAKEELVEIMKKLLEVINQQGQGYECYIPLMGTGLSRSGLDHKQALHYIVSTMELYSEEIYSTLNVVIYNGDRDKVKIFDN